MKKVILGLVLALSIPVGMYATAGSPSKPVLVNTAGVKVVAGYPAVLDSIVLGTVAPDATIDIYDSSTALTTAAQLKFQIVVSAGVTQTAQGRNIPINATFSNGVVVAADTSTSTITASFLVKGSN